MSPGYRTDLIPRWVWIMLVIAGLLILFVAFSMAGVRRSGLPVVGQAVKTGNPRDYVRKPVAPPPPVEITPAPAATPPTPSATVPQGLPQSFKFNKQVWIYSSGPVELDVETTGEYADDHIIYHRLGAQPPYDALFLESAPNSGQFYKYVPSPTTAGGGTSGG